MAVPDLSFALCGAVLGKVLGKRIWMQLVESCFGHVEIGIVFLKHPVTLHGARKAARTAWLLPPCYGALGIGLPLASFARSVTHGSRQSLAGRGGRPPITVGREASGLGGAMWTASAVVQFGPSRCGREPGGVLLRIAP